MDHRLRYRRQFLLTKAPLSSFIEWQYFKIKEYYLYVHPDVEVNQVENSQRQIVLVGSIFDPAEPGAQNACIIKTIHANADNVGSLFLHIKRYAGSYALIYMDGKYAVILSDPFAIREIYYCNKNNLVVCGSQPNLVAKFANPEISPRNDNDFLNYYNKHVKNSKWNRYFKWIGDETYYEGVNHLLPNHYLDIKKREVHRYWPNEPIKRLGLEEAVEKICAYLQGSICAIVHRHPVMIAVTSGTDSRTLLAASRGMHDKIYYFINNEGLGHDHPDISVPKNMFESLGIPFHVHDVPNDVDDEFNRIFMDNTFFASDNVLPTIYNVYFKQHSEKVNLSGNGEIGRTRLGKPPKKLNGYRMAYKLGYRDGRYPVQQGEKILTELLPVARNYGLNVFTLLYWEHYCGNWGTIGNSESDIAIDELDPYDSHMLYELLLGVDDKYTKYYNPILFREMIGYIWDKLLEWPINPPHTMRDKTKDVLRKIGIFEFMKECKYQINYYKYIYKTKF